MAKIVNIYLVYDAWLRNCTNNFKFKNCLFGATSIVKSIDKEKYVYSGYRTTIGNSGSWSFDNNTPRNVIIFGVDNSSSSQSDNLKNDFLILGECLTFEIMEALIYQRKKLALILVKQTQNFARVCITMPIIVICLLMNKKSLNLKSTIKMF